MRAIIAAAVAVLCSTQTARGDAQADPKLVARAIERAGKIGGGGLAEGSAPDFVDRLCEDIALGADGEFLAKSFDLAIIPPSPGDPLRNLAEHLDSVLVQFRAAAGRGDATYLGWLVDPRVTVTDGATWVRLDVVYKNGIGEPGHSETRVALTGAAPHWRILDVVADGMSLREDLADLPGIARDDALAAIRDALATGRFADALEEAQRAVALFPEDGAARSHLATALYYAYQFEAAGTEADRAIKLDPRQVQVHALRARLHLTRGDDRAARAAALQAAELGDLEGARLVEQLDIVAAARERLLGRRPALAEGSAPAFVDDHLDAGSG